MIFSVFVWGITAFLFIFVGICTKIGQNLQVKNRVKNNSLFFAGLLFLAVFLCLYVPHSTNLWVLLNKVVYPYLQTTKYAYNLSEVWYTIVFFKNMWPSILVVAVITIVDNIQYPITSRYRMLKQFSHNKLIILVGSAFLYCIARVYSDAIASISLGILVYAASFYWRFGFAIVLYILKRSNIPYEVGMLAMVVGTVVSGEYFTLPLVMFIGFGLSDIWMDYYKRDAASLVFNFDYH